MHIRADYLLSALLTCEHLGTNRTTNDCLDLNHSLKNLKVECLGPSLQAKRIFSKKCFYKLWVVSFKTVQHKRLESPGNMKRSKWSLISYVFGPDVVTSQKCVCVGGLITDTCLNCYYPNPSKNLVLFDLLCFRNIFLIYIIFVSFFLSFLSSFNLKQNPLILFSVYKMKASSDVFLQGIMFFGMAIHCMQLLNLTVRAHMRVVFCCFFLNETSKHSTQGNFPIK